MQEPKAPYWNPDLPRWEVQDIDRYIKNGIQSYPEVLKVVNSVGGIDAYRNMALNFQKADALYQIDHAKWRIQESLARGSNAISGDERWLARAYEKAAKSNIFSDAERAQFAGLSQDLFSQAAANKIIEERQQYLSSNASKVQNQMFDQIFGQRNAEYDRLSEEQTVQRAAAQKAYENDMAEAARLRDGGLIPPAEFSELVKKLTANYSGALNEIGTQFKAARNSVRGLADKQLAYASDTYNAILSGNFDPEKKYELPAIDYTPASISHSYKAVYAPRESAEVTEQQPSAGQAPTNTPAGSAASAPTTSAPTTPTTLGSATSGPAKSTPTTPSTGSTTPSQPTRPTKIDVREAPKVARAPTRNSSDLMARARVVDQSTQPSAATTGGGVVQQQPQPGLINNAGLLNYTPTINAPTGAPGLLTNQNPMLYFYNVPGGRAPGQMQAGG
jgi:hypothetical protein